MTAQRNRIASVDMRSIDGATENERMLQSESRKVIQDNARA